MSSKKARVEWLEARCDAVDLLHCWSCTAHFSSMVALVRERITQWESRVKGELVVHKSTVLRGSSSPYIHVVGCLLAYSWCSCCCCCCFCCFIRTSKANQFWTSLTFGFAFALLHLVLVLLLYAVGLVLLVKQGRRGGGRRENRQFDINMKQL